MTYHEEDQSIHFNMVPGKVPIYGKKIGEGTKHWGKVDIYSLPIEEAKEILSDFVLRASGYKGSS